MDPTWLAGAALMAATAGVELPRPPAISVLNSPAFEIVPFTRSGCAAKTFADFEYTLGDPSQGLHWLATRILAYDLQPIEVRVIAAPAEEYLGIFRHSGTWLGMRDQGRIEIMCATRDYDTTPAVLHEMGHLLMYRAYGYRLLPDPFGPGHAATELGLTTPGSAWAEGFADVMRMNYRPGLPAASCGWPGDCADDHFRRIMREGPLDPVWVDLPWRKRIANERFVEAMLWQLDKETRLERVVETMSRAKEDLRSGRHLDFDQFLQHFLRLYPQETDTARAAALAMGAGVDLPDHLSP